MGLFSPDVTIPEAPKAPQPADPTDESIRRAKLMERRRQLGLSGSQSTWLTGARGDTNDPMVAFKTLLGE